MWSPGGADAEGALSSQDPGEMAKQMVGSLIRDQALGLGEWWGCSVGSEEPAGEAIWRRVINSMS